jgi:hypothetical protein
MEFSISKQSYPTNWSGIRLDQCILDKLKINDAVRLDIRNEESSVGHYFKIVQLDKDGTFHGKVMDIYLVFDLGFDPVIQPEQVIQFKKEHVMEIPGAFDWVNIVLWPECCDKTEEEIKAKEAKDEKQRIRDQQYKNGEVSDEWCSSSEEDEEDDEDDILHCVVMGIIEDVLNNPYSHPGPVSKEDIRRYKRKYMVSPININPYPM